MRIWKWSRRVVNEMKSEFREDKNPVNLFSVIVYGNDISCIYPEER